MTDGNSILYPNNTSYATYVNEINTHFLLTFQMSGFFLVLTFKHLFWICSHLILAVIQRPSPPRQPRNRPVLDIIETTYEISSSAKAY